jgi:hypothetical protein
LASEDDIEVAITSDLLDQDVVDDILVDEEGSFMAIVVKVIDIFTASIYLRLIDCDVINLFDQRCLQLEEFFAFLRDANDLLSLADEDL